MEVMEVAMSALTAPDQPALMALPLGGEQDARMEADPGPVLMAILQPDKRDLTLAATDARMVTRRSAPTILLLNTVTTMSHSIHSFHSIARQQECPSVP